ncbi:uncharacterized protein LOC123873893 isoform X2 [Maniola jurtina]|uniref:uncharacterized protein LOC123873893 isoform X2 n=1 Tax=Maniola jurtina TaxID=191418 RepID=UPI001E68F4F2|nr:uncharacterized protein LOC123873893 isoform X2 [Maniola jurtina]
MLSASLFLSCVVLTQAFFLFGDDEPLLFCIKICPLYCSPRRRRDVDSSSLIHRRRRFIEHSPYIPYNEGYEDHGHHEGHEYHDGHEYHEGHEYLADYEVVPYHFDPYYFCKPHKFTTTTPAPTTMKTTTTEGPTGICMICMRKCTKYPKAKKS